LAIAKPADLATLPKICFLGEEVPANGIRWVDVAFGFGCLSVLLFLLHLPTIVGCHAMGSVLLGSIHCWSCRVGLPALVFGPGKRNSILSAFSLGFDSGCWCLAVIRMHGRWEGKMELLSQERAALELVHATDDRRRH
jgi:hypothetical protein